MQLSIDARQKQEWQEHFAQWQIALDHLEANELLIRKRFGFTNDQLGVEWREKIQHCHRAFVEEWAFNGWRNEQLSERHKQELEDAEQKCIQAALRNSPAKYVVIRTGYLVKQ